MTEFAPFRSLAGGVLIGLAASLLLVGNGRVAGVSGIAADCALGRAGDRAWRAAFLLGLVLAGSLLSLLMPGALVESPRSLGLVAAAGLIVGVGTRLGSGCTSGHGVCGVSRLSPRSLVATVTFIVTGVLTVTGSRWFGGTP